MKKLIDALRVASTDEARCHALRAMRSVIEAGRSSLRAAAPAVREALADPHEDVRVCALLVLQAAGARGFDLTPDVPALVAALHDWFSHHAVRALIDYVRADPSRAEAVLAEIARHDRARMGPGVDKVISVCTSGVPSREWTWAEASVSTHDGVLSWRNRVPRRSSGGLEQTFDSFRAYGPRAGSGVKDHEIPEDVYREISALLGAPPPPRRTTESLERDIQEALAALRGFAREAAPSGCPTCAELKPGRVDHLAGESRPPAWNRLVSVIGWGLGNFSVCPECGAPYEEWREVDNEPFRGTDQSGVYPVTLAEVEKRLRRLAFELEWKWWVTAKAPGPGGS